jgi:hypothetical protein
MVPFSSSVSLPFTIANAGPGNLSIDYISINGTDDFTSPALFPGGSPTMSLAPSASYTFYITASWDNPLTWGYLVISNNNTGEGPFTSSWSDSQYYYSVSLIATPTMPVYLAIQPILFRSTFFPLGIGVSLDDLLTGSYTPAYTGSEDIQPYGITFVPGQKVALNASQNLYSFDYYEVWPPNEVYESYLYYPSPYGFTVSYDPKTKVILNQTSSIVGTSLRTKTGIVARYR